MPKTAIVLPTSHPSRRLLNLPTIFNAIWVSNIAVYCLNLTTWQSQAYGLLALLYGLSAISFASGYMVVRLSTNEETNAYLVEVNKTGLLACVATMLVFVGIIVAFNYVRDGLPPFFVIFGHHVLPYDEYGRFRTILFPLLTAAILSSAFCDRPWLHASVVAGGFALMLVYIARGNLIQTLLQLIALHIIRRQVSFRRFLAYILILVAFLLLIMTGLGAVRLSAQNTTLQNFAYEWWSVRPELRWLHPGLVWTLAYVTVPMSNLLHLMQQFNTTYSGLLTVNDMLPAFASMTAKTKAAALFPKVGNLKDLVFTYLGHAFGDFSWPAVAGMNFLLGLVAGILTSIRVFLRHSMLYCLFISCMMLMAFHNFFFYFPTLMEAAVLTVVGILFIRLKPLPPGQGPTMRKSLEFIA